MLKKVQAVKSSIEKQILLRFGLATVILFVINALSYWSTVEQRKTADSVTHTYKVLKTLDETLSNVKDAETGQRGYLITGEESYLEPFYDGVASVHQGIETLRKLTADNSSQQQRLNSLSPVVAQKLAELSQTVDLRQKEGFEAARAVVKTAHGKNFMDRIRQIIREMNEEENKLLKQRIEWETVAVDIQNIFSTTALLFNVILFYLIYRAIQSDLAKRRQIKAALERNNQYLEGTVASHTVELCLLNEQLQGSEERYQQVVELCPDAIFIHCRGLIVFVNQAAIQLFGATTSEELIGSCVLDHIPSDHWEIAKEQMQQLHKGCCSILVEEKFKRLDGMLVEVEVAAIPFTYQNQPAAQVVARNITVRKRIEEELRSTLEKEKELSCLKSRIITTISHEYRTPLATIQSSCDLLEYYADKWTSEKKATHFNRIQRTVKHLTDLLDDVLLVDRLDASQLPFNPTALNLELLYRALVEEMTLTAIGSHSVIFKRSGNGTEAYLDEKLVRQILSNLLSNAIKYSPEGATIYFELIDNSHQVIFRIQDRGIGITAPDRSEVFKSFFRGSNVGTIPGTGLGLAIVKKAVELHGGQVTVDSEVGVGTTFTVTLPQSLKPEYEVDWTTLVTS